MKFLCPTLVFASVFAITTADYECLCNYHVENPVYPTTDNQAAHLGSLYEFDCKPTYQLTAAIPHWQAIQFEHQVRPSNKHRVVRGKQSATIPSKMFVQLFS